LLESTPATIFGKLKPIAGDVGENDLGISPKDRQTLIDNVDVVIHSAATLDFQASLRPTVEINLLGTRRVTELCQQMKNIKVNSERRKTKSSDHQFFAGFGAYFKCLR
jgi:alcohol-forming fatty acyl-CoA reductase